MRPIRDQSEHAFLEDCKLEKCGLEPDWNCGKTERETGRRVNILFFKKNASCAVNYGICKLR